MKTFWSPGSQFRWLFKVGFLSNNPAPYDLAPKLKKLSLESHATPAAAALFHQEM